MTRALFVVGILLFGAAALPAHDPITTKITWSREISRLIYKRCASCHHEGGRAFSLMTYEDARPWAKAIKEETLRRRMPPFGAVKGFGDIRDDQALTQEELYLFSDWVEGGVPEGDPALLPPQPEVNLPKSAEPEPGSRTRVGSGFSLPKPMQVTGLRPEGFVSGKSARIVAVKPDGGVVPLIWIYQFRPEWLRTYWLRKPAFLPAGTKIVFDSGDAGSVSLVSSTSGPKRAH